MIEVHCYDVYSIGIFVQPSANAAVSCVSISISIWWDVNSCYHDDSKRSRVVKMFKMLSDFLVV